MRYFIDLIKVNIATLSRKLNQKDGLFKVSIFFLFLKYRTRKDGERWKIRKEKPKGILLVRRSSWSSDRGNFAEGMGMGERKAGPAADSLSVGLNISHEPEDGGGGR